MPKINTAYSFDVALVSQADTKLFQVNPTLAAGDVKISGDEGAFTNLTNLPAVTPAGGRNVKVILTAAEMNVNRAVIQFVDASGAEWCDLVLGIETTPDDLSIAAIADGVYDEQLSGHVAAGSGGLALAGAVAPTAIQNADALLARDLGSGTGAGTLNERTVRAALRWNRNECTIVGNVLTVYKEDGVSVAWTGTVTGALVTALGVDPA